jgi:tRNA threonylcarbamoyladenosine biosynthesis protein TsaE
MEWIFTLKQINRVAFEWWSTVNEYKVFAFHGQLGSGKTTFIHSLCDAKGIVDLVTSPTFSLINEYRLPGGQRIFHIDLYRIVDEDEAVRAGIEDCLYEGNICFVEWPERAPAIFPPDTVLVYIEVIDIETRKVKILFPRQIL